MEVHTLEAVNEIVLQYKWNDDKHGSAVLLYKGKDDKHECRNSVECRCYVILQSDK